MSSWQWDDPEVGYEPHERSGFLGLADDDRKRARERGERNPLVAEWEDEMRAEAAEKGRCEYGMGNGRCIQPVGHRGGHYLIAGRS